MSGAILGGTCVLSACAPDAVSPPAQIPPEHATVDGWSLERPMNQTEDDWEPTVAADPRAPYVYVLTTRYGGVPACPSACPDPALILRVSADGGATFGQDRYLCRCEGVPSQNDPQLAVAGDGTVFAAWLNGYVPGVMFAKSVDHGATWTAPRPVMGPLPWSDKPILVAAYNARDIYIAFNSSDSYVVSSHDGGATFGPPVRTNADERYYFAYGGVVTSAGDVIFSETSYTQTSTGPVFVHTIRSGDGGRSWRATRVDVVEEQPDCPDEGCPRDFLGPAAAIGGTPGGEMVLVYNGALMPKGAQRTFVRRSTDVGRTWSTRVDLSPPGASVNSAFPAAVGVAARDLRIWYMDNRNGADLWNVWSRRSTDGGATWSAESRLSNAPDGAPYKSAGGFAHPYGDYGGAAVTSSGITVADWGEGMSYVGPGGTWGTKSDGAQMSSVAGRDKSGAAREATRTRWVERKRERAGPRPGER